MRITLIGMSGSGKSLWSSVLSRHGFHKLGCDNAIGRRLVDGGELSEGSLDLIGRWMGFPFETGFARREALYLDHEKAVMDQFLTELETRPADDASPVVIDTTGSVIYTGKRYVRGCGSRPWSSIFPLPPPFARSCTGPTWQTRVRYYGNSISRKKPARTTRRPSNAAIKTS